MSESENDITFRCVLTKYSGDNNERKYLLFAFVIVFVQCKCALILITMTMVCLHMRLFVSDCDCESPEISLHLMGKKVQNSMYYDRPIA